MQVGSPSGPEDSLKSELARAREAATREILDLISRSREDAGLVFDAILHRAASLCNSDAAALVMGKAGDTHQRLAASYGVAPATIASYERGEVSMDPDTKWTARAILTGTVLHVEDLMDTDDYRRGNPTTRSVVEDSGIRSEIYVPLVTMTGAIGLLIIFRKEVRPFTPDEIGLAEAFAAQAVIAIENVRQFRELQTRLEREAATREILSVISQSRDDDRPVFDVILRNAIRLCAGDTSAHLLGRRDDPHMTLAAWRDRASASSVMDDEMITQTNASEMRMDPSLHVTAKAIIEEQNVHILDMTKHPAYLSGELSFVIMVDTLGVRTALFVPLIGSRGALGSVNVHRREVRPFTPDEIALVETFAAQAVIAIENVRQFRELQTRLEREAATREILEVISQSRDDDKPVFDAVLRRAADLCGAYAASLVLGKAGDTHLRITAQYGEETATDEMFSRGEVAMDPESSFAARAILAGKVVHIADLMDTDQYRSGVKLVLSAVHDTGIRTNLYVPLLAPEGAIGCFIIYRREVRPYTPDEISLAETFAAQAVIAIENVRQFRELQDRLAREAATREILEVISQSRDNEKPVFDVIVFNVARLCATNLVTLDRINPEGTHLNYAAHSGAELRTFDLGDDWPLDSALQIAQSVREGRAIHSPDLANTDAYRAGDPFRRRLVDEEGVQSLLTVPLITVDRRAIGCIGLYRQELRPFTPDEIALVETFAAQAVIAIENVRQFKALEALNAELGDRVEAQVGEIDRMARLKRFLPAAVADAVVSSGSEKLLSSHRALLGVLFCDIRGFTAFCETAEPEETIEVLQTYHEEMGKLINAHGAGVDHRMGDGIMVLFNDPLPCDDPAGTAVRLAIAMRNRMAELCEKWKRMGHRLGFGVGISMGYATVGMVGSGGRQDYTASGTAVNLAERLCGQAKDGEILISPRVRMAIEDNYSVEARGEFALKGIREPVEVFRLTPTAP